MRWIRCRQCGSEAHDGKTCAERLEELLFASTTCERLECLEAVARFALAHPATFSEESLELARQQLARTCRPWRVLVERLGSRVTRRILRRLH